MPQARETFVRQDNEHSQITQWPGHVGHLADGLPGQGRCQWRLQLEAMFMLAVSVVIARSHTRILTLSSWYTMGWKPRYPAAPIFA